VFANNTSIMSSHSNRYLSICCKRKKGLNQSAVEVGRRFLHVNRGGGAILAFRECAGCFSFLGVLVYGEVCLAVFSSVAMGGGAGQPR